MIDLVVSCAFMVAFMGNSKEKNRKMKPKVRFYGLTSSFHIARRMKETFICTEVI